MTSNNRLNKWYWRVYPLWVFLIISLLIMIFRLVQLQVSDKENGNIFLKKQGDARTLRDEVIYARRGEIFDRNGRLLAFSTPVQTIWANPKIMDVTKIDFQKLSSILEMEIDFLKNKLSKNTQFVYLSRQISPEKASIVMSEKIKGIFSKTEYKRFYPAGEVVSHLVGFTDIDDRGQEGIELSFDNDLRSKFGLKKVMRNAHHETIKDIKQIKIPQNGKKINLSIDLRVQYIAYKELKRAVKKHNAKSGSVVIIDTNTGEVLALANQPSFNSNDRKQFFPERIRNRAIIDMFEPASTMKPFTVMAALESEKFDESSVIDTSPGILKIGDKIINDHRNFGQVDFTTLLAKSSNVGVSKVALSLDVDHMHSLFSRVGFGEFCATGFPGEQSGYLPNHSEWVDIKKANLSFGYGLSVNAIQLARAYGVIANEGVKKPISLLRVRENPSINLSDNYEVVSSLITKKILNMMEKVVTKEGTGVKAKIPGYRVAGKTGTAKKVSKKGYEEGNYRATFAGIIPASSPRLVAIITIDDPQGDEYSGGDVAAPIFSKVMEPVVRLLNIPPDNTNEINHEVFLSQKKINEVIKGTKESHGSA